MRHDKNRQQEVIAIAAMLAFAARRSAEVNCSDAAVAIEHAISELLLECEVDFGMRDEIFSINVAGRRTDL